MFTNRFIKHPQDVGISGRLAIETKLGVCIKIGQVLGGGSERANNRLAVNNGFHFVSNVLRNRIKRGGSFAFFKIRFYVAQFELI